MRAYAIRTLALGCLLAAVATSAAEEKKAKKAWEGTWECVSRTVNGKTQDAKGFLLIHEGDKYTLKKGDKVISEGTSKRDTTVKPHTIDTTPSTGKFKGKVAHGIYEIKGDTMKMCIAFAGKDRPKDFSSAADSGTILETWKRAASK